MIFVETVEWDDVTAIKGEIGIVKEIYSPDDETIFFDLNVQLADGGDLPVWTAEVEKLEDVSSV